MPSNAGLGEGSAESSSTGGQLVGAEVVHLKQMTGRAHDVSTLSEQGDAVGDLVVADDEGGRDAQRGGAGGAQHQGGCHARGDHFGGGAFSGQLHAEQQAPAPNAGHPVERFQRGLHGGPGLGGLGGQVDLLHHLEGGFGRRRREGLTAEGGGVVAGLEGGGYLGLGPTGPDGHAVAQGLGHGHHVGLNPVVVVGEPAPGAGPGRSAPRRA